MPYKAFPIDTDQSIIQACIQNIKDNSKQRYAGCTTTSTEIQVHYIMGYTPPVSTIKFDEYAERQLGMLNGEMP